MNLRLDGGAMLQGGFSAGRQMMDECDIVGKIDNPSTYLCHRESALLPQVKLMAALSAAVVGPAGERHVPEPGARPGRRRRLQLQLLRPVRQLRGDQRAGAAVAGPQPSSSGGNVTVNVVEPGTLYPGRTNQLDMRASKRFNLGSRRVQGMFDLYNVLNSNNVLRLNPAYGTNGAAWGRPQAIVPGRLIKFGAQVNF